MVKNLIIGIVVVIMVVLGFTAFNSKKETSPVKPGAISSPDIASPYISFGGVRQWASQTTLITSTTTVCRLVSPVATSSLIGVGISFKTSSTTAMTGTIATSTPNSGNTASTTALSTFVLGANASDVFTYRGGNGDVMKPNTPINITLAGGTGTFSPTGNCEARWVQIDY